MAIQEVESKEVQGAVGVARGINEHAFGMVMDIVQAQQYTKPIPSTIRELTANAVDSQSEKERALSILKGTSKVEDYFVNREGGLYEDSKWDPSYYDPKHLDTENNTVEIIYKEREGTGRVDSIIIRDRGVGLGKKRLEGAVSIGYSTKRCRTDALGAFG